MPCAKRARLAFNTRSAACGATSRKSGAGSAVGFMATQSRSPEHRQIAAGVTQIKTCRHRLPMLADIGDSSSSRRSPSRRSPASRTHSKEDIS